jgi:Asp/Glu/hydantoin racemase
VKHTAGMVHYIVRNVELFNRIAAEVMPDVEVIHLVDEGMLKELLRGMGLTELMARRLQTLVSLAEESGAEAVMVTGSSSGPLVPQIKDRVRVPVLRVDEAMADEAVRLGTQIGVLATSQTTIGPTTGLIQERAGLAGKRVNIETAVCQGAFEAHRRGDYVTHDALVKKELKALIKRVQVVVLAQATMERVADQLSDREKSVPILTSPRLGVQRLKQMLEQVK